MSGVDIVASMRRTESSDFGYGFGICLCVFIFFTQCKVIDRHIYVQSNEDSKIFQRIIKYSSMTKSLLLKEEVPVFERVDVRIFSRAFVVVSNAMEYCDGSECCKL